MSLGFTGVFQMGVSPRSGVFQMVSPQHHRSGGREDAENTRLQRQLPGAAEQVEPRRLHIISQVSFAF